MSNQIFATVLEVFILASLLTAFFLVSENQSGSSFMKRVEVAIVIAIVVFLNISQRIPFLGVLIAIIVPIIYKTRKAVNNERRIKGDRRKHYNPHSGDMGKGVLGQ